MSSGLARKNLLENAPNQKVVGGSKAVGEPPFMLAISVVTALRNGIMALGMGLTPSNYHYPRRLKPS